MTLTNEKKTVPFRKKKGVRGLLILTLVLVIALVIVQLAFLLYFDSSVRSELESRFKAQTQGAYELKIDDLKTNFLNQSLHIRGVKITPVKDANPENAKYYLSAAKVNLINFNLTDLFSHKILNFKRLELDSPMAIIFRNNTNKDSASDSSKMAHFSSYGFIKPFINGLSIQHIEIINSALTIYDNDRDSLLILKSSDNKLLVSNLRINKASEKAGSLFLADKTELSIGNFAFITADKRYTIKVSKLFASYNNSSLLLDSVQVTPNYSRDEFALKSVEQTDRFTISASRIALKKIDVKLFFEKNWFIASRATINDLNLEAYRDRNYARSDRHPPSVQSLIAKIPELVIIDSIIFNNALCVYQELEKNSTDVARISMNKMHVVVTGFTNQAGYVNRSGHLLVNAECEMMDRAHLTVQYSFPYDTEETRFDCSGHLHQMPFMALNPIFEPITKVSFTDGIINDMNFSFHAGENVATGEMKLAYNNLKVRFNLARQTKQKNKLITYIAHQVFIKEENPTGDQPLRVTRINFKRDKERFIFSYSLRAVLTGINEAILIKYGGKK